MNKDPQQHDESILQNPPSGFVGVDPMRVSDPSPRQKALLLPSMILLSAFAKFLTIPWMILGPSSVYLHELGHASAALLSGFMALPLPIFTFWSSTPSFFIKLCIFLLSGYIAFQGWRYRCKIWIIVGVVLFFLQIWFVRKPYEQQVMLMIAGGCGGEILLGALLAASTFYRMPDFVRWDFFRLLALPIGIYSLWSASILWHRAQLDASLIPWGSILGGEGGDMDRLVRDYGWTPSKIVSTYWGLCRMSWIFLLVHYAGDLLFDVPRKK